MIRKFILIAASALLSSCGGGSGSTTSVPTVVTSATTPTPIPLTSVSVQTYERLANTAYPALITLQNATISTESVNVETPKTSGDYTQLTITKPGFIPIWYPYSPLDTTPIQVGLYRASPINKQTNFVKAINPHDAGGWLIDYYKGGYFPSTVERIANIGGNNVVYADSAIIKAMDVNAKTVSLYGKFFPSDQALADMASAAKARGVELTFMMGIYPGDTLGNDSWTVPKFYEAISQLNTTDPFWDAWFDAYKNILVERAALAQKLGATRFAIGFNLDYMVPRGNARWAGLIKAVRAAGFTGKISYFGGTNGAYNGFLNIQDPKDRADFIKLFDEIGLDFYNPIIPQASEILSADQPRERILSGLRTQIATVSSYGVPVFILIGTPSVHSGVSSQDYIEPALSCGALKGYVRDYQVQADVYQAAAELVNEQSGASANPIKGIFSWGYHYIDNPRKHTTVGDVCYDYAASIRNKPAEAVLSYWFKGW